MAFSDDIGKFLVGQVVDPKAERKYLRMLASSPFFGTTNVKAVNADFAGPQELLRTIREDTAETVAGLPDYEEFRAAVLPFLIDEASSSGRYVPGDRQAYDVNERMAELGLVRPYGVMLRGAADKPVLGESVKDLLKRGQVERAVQAEYEATQNLARLTPMSMIREGAKRGQPLFYPLRDVRNTMWSAETGLPKDLFDMGSSIASMQAGPYIEGNRVLAHLPFVKIGKNDKAFFDLDGFIKVFGEEAARGPGAKELREELVRAVEDPNYLSRRILGISDKTAPYNMMALLPNSQTAYVDDSIMESVSTGADSGGLPGSAMSSMYGQMPGRALAAVYGVSPSTVQEAGWFTPRLLKGESSSAIPFERNITDAQIDDIVAGKLTHNPNSPNPRPEETRELSKRLRKYLGRQGQLVDPEVVALANAVRVPSNLEEGLSVKTRTFEGNPVKVVTPEDTIENAMAFQSRGFADRYKAALDAVSKLGPKPDPRNVAVILAAFGIPVAAFMSEQNRGSNAV